MTAGLYTLLNEDIVGVIIIKCAEIRRSLAITVLVSPSGPGSRLYGIRDDCAVFLYNISWLSL